MRVNGARRGALSPVAFVWIGTKTMDLPSPGFLWLET